MFVALICSAGQFTCWANIQHMNWWMGSTVLDFPSYLGSKTNHDQTCKRLWPSLTPRKINTPAAQGFLQIDAHSSDRWLESLSALKALLLNNFPVRVLWNCGGACQGFFCTNWVVDWEANKEDKEESGGEKGREENSEKGMSCDRDVKIVSLNARVPCTAFRQ